MGRRYSLILDGRTIELPETVTDDDEAERYARLAVLARYGTEGRLGSLGWQRGSVSRYRQIFRSTDATESHYVGLIQCHEDEPAEADPKKTS